MADYSGYGMPVVDFSIIGNLGKTYDEAKRKAARDQALSQLGNGASLADVAKAAFQGGDIEAGLALSKAEDARALRDYTMKKDDRDFGFRQQESNRAQGNADRAYNAAIEGARVPTGFEAGPGGALRPKAGGPNDPAYLQQAADAKAKPRDFSVGDITKLSDEGGKFASLASFNNTFDPRFAGYKSSAVGNLANTAGRMLPEGVVGKDVAEGASWWQGYDRYKNVVRNDLFGSALTKPETEAFEKADVNPGMTPEQIKKNLAVQKQVVTNGLKRKANALIQSGFDPKAISAAYGLDLSEIGVTAQPRRGAAPTATPQQSPATERPKVPFAAVRELQANPNSAEQFDEIFGQGTAARVLGVVR